MNSAAINTDNARSVYNTAAIMAAAHAGTRALLDHPKMKGRAYAEIFAGQLRNAWNQAKWAAQSALAAARRAMAPKVSKDPLGD